MRATEQLLVIAFSFAQKDNYMHSLLFRNLKTPLFCYSWCRMMVSTAAVSLRLNCQMLSFTELFCFCLACRNYYFRFFFLVSIPHFRLSDTGLSK